MLVNRILGFAVFHLVEDPCVGPFEAGSQRDRRLPAELAFDQCVVAASAAELLWGVELVIALDLDPSDFLGEIHEPVDRHHLRASNVDGIGDVAIHERACSVNAVVDKHEAARALPSPQISISWRPEFRGDDLPADPPPAPSRGRH